MDYIALLRGINVGGHTVKMDALRKLFVELGLTNVRTYIQSGNVFFTTESADRAVLAERIERHLRAALGYEVPACLRTIPELERVVAVDPFASLTVTPDMRLCVMFTNDLSRATSRCRCAHPRAAWRSSPRRRMRRSWSGISRMAAHLPRMASSRCWARGPRRASSTPPPKSSQRPGSSDSMLDAHGCGWGWD